MSFQTVSFQTLSLQTIPILVGTNIFFLTNIELRLCCLIQRAHLLASACSPSFWAARVAIAAVSSPKQRQCLWTNKCVQKPFEHEKMVLIMQIVFTYHPSPACCRDTIQTARFCKTCSRFLLSLKSCHCCHFCFPQSNLFLSGSSLFSLKVLDRFLFFFSKNISSCLHALNQSCRLFFILPYACLRCSPRSIP